MNGKKTSCQLQYYPLGVSLMTRWLSRHHCFITTDQSMPSPDNIFLFFYDFLRVKGELGEVKPLFLKMQTGQDKFVGEKERAFQKHILKNNRKYHKLTASPRVYDVTLLHVSAVKDR